MRSEAMKSERRQYLEQCARSVGYNAERDDTDSDLILICHLRGLLWVN